MIWQNYKRKIKTTRQLSINFSKLSKNWTSSKVAQEKLWLKAMKQNLKKDKRISKLKH